MNLKPLNLPAALRRIAMRLVMLLALLLPFSAAAQTREIHGQVINTSDKEPLIGVTVLNTDTKEAVATDIDGNYTIAAEPGQTLSFSYVGCKTKTVKVGSGSTYDVALEDKAKMLNEVVVVGFGQQKKINLTGAVGVIGAEEINGRPVVSAAQALQGLDPSLNIGINSGRADSGYQIDIRGASSLNSSSPLILVDGVEMALNRLNPNDIESVSVLKDASAAAVYGAKASAGVVLVTTKSGTDSKVKVSYNGRVGWAQNTTKNDFITCGYDWATITDQFFYYSNGQQGNKYFKYTDDDYAELYARRNDKTENPDRPWVTVAEDGTYRYYGNFDWYNYFYKKNRFQQEHNVSIRGGNDNVKYYISGRYYGTQGVMNLQNDPYDSYSIRSKIDIKLSRHVTFRSNIGYFYSKMKWPGAKNQQLVFEKITQGCSPVFVPTNPDGTIVHKTNLTNQSTSVGNNMNLVLTYGKNHNHESINEVTVKNGLDIDFGKGVALHLNHAYKFLQNFAQYRYSNAPYSNTEGVIVWETTSMFRNELSEYNNHNYKHTFEAYADFHHTWNQKHNFTAMAGMQYDTRWYHRNTVTVDGNLSEDLNDFNLATGPTYEVTGGKSKYQTLGFFGRLNYDYAGKYLLEASGRADGTSRFWSKNRWGFFPSGSAGWRISQEKFWEPLRSWWTDAKIRFSIGSLGNQQVSDYLFVQTINTSKTNDSYTFDGTNSLAYAREDDPVASDLTWERVTTYDWGLDLSFFNSRLQFNGDYYIRRTTNMMMAGASLPSVYGANEPKTNAADMRTNGWELQLSWRDQLPLAGRPLLYNVHGSLGDYKTVVTRFDNDTRLIGEHYVGETLGEIWGYRTDGLFQSDEEAAAYAEAVDCSLVTKRIDATGTRQGLHAGDLKFLDLNGNGKLDRGENTVDNPGDRVVIGNSLPRYSYTFGLDLTWNGIDFSILFQGVGKRDWYPGDGTANLFWGPYCRPNNSFLSKTLVNQIWSEDNPNGYFPFPRGYEANTSASPNPQDRTLTAYNDRYLQSVAYLRLKNLTVGYTLPWLKKYAQTIRVYFSGENLAYWSPLKKHCVTIDPEAAVSTVSYSDNSGEVYSFSKVFTFGLDVTF